MDKTSHSVEGDGSVKGAIRQLLIDLNEMPEEEEEDDLNEPPKSEVAAPLNLYIDLRFCKADMAELKQKHKVVAPSSAAFSDDSKDLRFDGACRTFMCTRDRRVQFKGKSLYALGRSLFKKGSTEKNKPQYVDNMKSFPKRPRSVRVEIRKEGDKNNKQKRNDEDAAYAKALLRDFIKQAKVRALARNAIKKGKGKGKVQKQVCCTFIPRGRRTTMYKPFPKLRNVNR